MTSHEDQITHSNEPQTTPQPGRPVILESAPPGLWTTVIGVGIAVLAPLFGFLIGTAIGPGDGGPGLSPIQIGLFLGVVVGGCGVLVAVAGGARLYREVSGRSNAS